MLHMEPKLTPTVITDLQGFGRLLNTLRTLAGWSQAEAGRRYGCVAGLISLREHGRRQVGIIDAVDVLEHHDYVLVVMHRDDATGIPRLRYDTESPPLTGRKVRSDTGRRRA